VRSMKKWMLGVALAAGIVGMSATPAQAARVRVGVYVGAPGYVPPCPGPGYVWVNGYWAYGYWVPGYWNYVGVGVYDWRQGPYYHPRDFDWHTNVQRHWDNWHHDDHDRR